MSANNKNAKERYFSPAMTLAGMDYIAPSAECIKPTLMRTQPAHTDTYDQHSSASSAAAASDDAIVLRHRNRRQRNGAEAGVQTFHGLPDDCLGDNTTHDQAVHTARDDVADGEELHTAQELFRTRQTKSGSIHAMHEPQPQFRPSPRTANLPPHREVIKITLQDCLACSGCVTTAETVLLNAQSRGELLRARREHATRPWLITISEQSAASLAAYANVSVREAYALVAGFMRSVLRRESAASSFPLARRAGDLSQSPAMAMNDAGQAAGTDSHASGKACIAHGPVYVSDLTWATQLSAEKTAKEYMRWCRWEPSRLPMLVSACPGWVCYCEKQGSVLLPHLCPVLSPQGLAGSLAKRSLSRDLYHVSIQPCFDRKLESARDGFVPDTEVQTIPATFGNDGGHSNHSCSSNHGEGDNGTNKDNMDSGSNDKYDTGNDSTTDESNRRDDGLSGTRSQPARDVPASRFVPYTDCVLSTAELLEWMCEEDATLPWRGVLNSAQTDCPASHPPYLDGAHANDASLLYGGGAAASDVALWRGSGGYHRRAILEGLSACVGTADSPTQPVPPCCAVHADGVPDPTRRDVDPLDQHDRAAIPVALSSQPSSLLLSSMRAVRYDVRRNRNHQLVTSDALPGHVFCIAYGFQQIQNVVRALRKRLAAVRTYTFVEFMACPGGCLNGGGQVVSVGGTAHAERLAQTERKFAAYMTTAPSAEMTPNGVDADGSSSSSSSSASPYRTNVEDEMHGGDVLHDETEHDAEMRRVDGHSNRTAMELRTHADEHRTDLTDGEVVFTVARMSARMESYGSAGWSCTFRDRQKEFEEMLNEGKVHSLKW